MKSLLLRFGISRTLSNTPICHPKMIDAKPNTTLAEVEAEMRQVYAAIWAAPTLSEREKRSRRYEELKKEYDRLTQGTHRKG